MCIISRILSRIISRILLLLNSTPKHKLRSITQHQQLQTTITPTDYPTPQNPSSTYHLSSPVYPQPFYQCLFPPLLQIILPPIPTPDTLCPLVFTIPQSVMVRTRSVTSLRRVPLLRTGRSRRAIWRMQGEEKGHRKPWVPTRNLVPTWKGLRDGGIEG